MRLFVAIELPERVKTAVADHGMRQAPKLPRASWVRASNLHLTLAFLGELDERQLPRLAEALVASAADGREFELAVEGAGCFPPKGSARVAWLGFAPCPGVLELQRSLSTRLRAAIGFESDRRPFRPHLTVARCNPPWPRAVAESWRGSLEGRLGEPFRIRSFALFKSRLDPSGAVHTVLQRFELAAA